MSCILKNKIVTTILPIALASISINAHANAAPPINPAAFSGAATQGFILANNKILLNILSQKSTYLDKLPAQSNDATNSSAIGPTQPYNINAGTSGAGALQKMFGNFHSNYTKQDSSMGPSIGPEDVPSDSIISKTYSAKLGYQGGLVHLIPGTTANPQDNKFNLAQLIATDRINPPKLGQSTSTLSSTVIQRAVRNNCESIANAITNTSQDFADGLDSSSLSTIAKDPVKTQKLLQDSWSKPPQKDAGDITQGLKGTGGNTDSYSASMPFGKPYWSNYLNTLHQVYSAKTMGYATIYHLCIERSPVRLANEKIGQPTPSPLQRMEAEANQINNKNYIKAIQSQSINANLKELIKVQNQTLQMLMRIHKDNETLNANIASINIVNSSNYGATASVTSSLNVNRELKTIAGSGKK